LLVQHLVVLEIVQQRGRHEIRIAGQEDRGARDDVRRSLLEALIRSFIGTSMRLGFCARIQGPRRQVQIRTAQVAPHSSGTQAPSSSLSRLAEKNVVSTTTKGSISAAALASRQFQSFQITMKPIRPSATIVVDTAMP